MRGPLSAASSLALTLLLFFTTHTLADKPRNSLPGTFFGTPGTDTTFDYVVVGGGTAGLTIATRLALAGSSVAVIEAGGFYEVDNGNRSVVPAYCGFYAGYDPSVKQPLVDWGFVTTPQPGAANRTLHVARGKTLGGSSARNFLYYQRPTIGSMQAWAEEVGDDSYTFERLLPFYQRSVDYTPPNAGAYEANGTMVVEDPQGFSDSGGPLQVSFGKTIDPLGTWVRRALLGAGMAQIAGFNTGHLLGSGYATATIDPEHAHRESSTGFLAAAMAANAPLTVYKNTMATVLLFNESGSSPVATGVQVDTSGLEFKLHARKEVIVSAGAFQSPQLLMVSGIGPCEGELKKYNISCVRDLPGVGQNLQDHLYVPVVHRVNVLTASAGVNDPSLSQAWEEMYLTNGTGPLGLPASMYLGWEKLPQSHRQQMSQSVRDRLARFPSDWPETEYLELSGYLAGGFIPYDPADGFNYATLAGSVVAPCSRGSVGLRSADMREDPVIDPQWLTDETDMEVAVQSFHRTRGLWAALAAMGIAHPVESFPGSKVQSDAQVRRYIEENFNSIYHPACTCRMGKDGDPMAVLDSRARVRGVQRLRVVDASSFPLLPPGHPQATVYALAEKIANDILHN